MENTQDLKIYNSNSCWICSFGIDWQGVAQEISCTLDSSA